MNLGKQNKNTLKFDKIEKNSPLPDYNVYVFSNKEKIKYVISGCIITSMFAYLFYESIFAMIVGVILIPLYIREKKKDLMTKQKQELANQFKEIILCVSSGLQAGYSVENAFREAYHEGFMMYGKKGMMTKELFYMGKSLDNNGVLEQLLKDFGRRSGLEDIRDFGEIFGIAKRNGGDMNGIIRWSVTLIYEKIELKKDLETIVSGKKMEQTIMNLIPFLIIFYIKTTSPGFFKNLYHSFTGVVVMTLCFGLYLVAFFMAKKITNIRV